MKLSVSHMIEEGSHSVKISRAVWEKLARVELSFLPTGVQLPLFCMWQKPGKEEKLEKERDKSEHLLNSSALCCLIYSFELVLPSNQILKWILLFTLHMQEGK